MNFQLFDVAANGGLGEVHCFSGFGKAFKFDNFAKNMELPKIHQFAIGRIARYALNSALFVIRYLLFAPDQLTNNQ